MSARDVERQLQDAAARLQPLSEISPGAGREGKAAGEAAGLAGQIAAKLESQARAREILRDFDRVARHRVQRCQPRECEGQTGDGEQRHTLCFRGFDHDYLTRSKTLVASLRTRGDGSLSRVRCRRWITYGSEAKNSSVRIACSRTFRFGL